VFPVETLLADFQASATPSSRGRAKSEKARDSINNWNPPPYIFHIARRGSTSTDLRLTNLIAELAYFFDTKLQ